MLCRLAAQVIGCYDCKGLYCFVGYEDKPVHLECNELSLLLQPYNSPPVIDRRLSSPIDCQQPIETFRYSPGFENCVVTSPTHSRATHKQCIT